MSPATKVPMLTVNTESPGACPSCDASLLWENIFRDANRSVLQRRVRAYCHACTRVFEGFQELSGGNWHYIGDVTVVNDERVRESVLKRVGKLAGDRQIAG